MEVVQTEEGGTYYLAQCLDDVKSFLDEAPDHGVLAMDTETTGLNQLKDKIVGMSFARKMGYAMYVPFAHKLGTNVPAIPALEIVKEYLETHKCYPVFWNGKFDVSFFSTNYSWVPDYYEDVMASVYLDNPDREEKGLKPVARDDLNFKMDSFQSLFTDAEIKARVFDISTKSPKRCTAYASADADATLRLHVRYAHIKEEFALPHKVDTQLMELIRKMEETGGMELNLSYINSSLKGLQQREKVLEEMIYRAAGQEFAIGSPKQLGDLLFGKLGLPPQGTTKSGQYSTGAKDLEKLAEQFPIAEWVVSYKKIQKAQGSYFEKLLYLHSKGIAPRFSFNQYAAPTYRLAAPGGDPDTDGKTGVNIQAVSNGEARTIMGVEIKVLEAGATNNAYSDALDDEDLMFADPSTKVQKTGGVLNTELVFKQPWVWDEEKGGKICVLDSCKHCSMNCEATGVDVTRRQIRNVLVIPSVRQSFRAPEGYVLMGCDYDRQELVIGANLSKEPKWVNALKNNLDLHAITAQAAFSVSPESWEKMDKDDKKRKRDIGKTLNFATFYGATAHTLSRNTGLSQTVAETIYNGFVKGHPQLFSWMDRVKLFARRNGYTTTYFGRRRWLKQFYNEGSNGMKAFADRSSVNTAVQGTGADVTRIAMVKCMNWLKNNNISWDDCRLVLSIHDELVFLIRKDLLNEIGPQLLKCMTFNVKGWEIQLSVEPKVGTVWGETKLYVFPTPQV